MSSAAVPQMCPAEPEPCVLLLCCIPRILPCLGCLLPQVSSRETSSSRAKVRRSLDARDVAEACEALSVGSSCLDSFNSEEGFGSPVKHKCEWGGVWSAAGAAETRACPVRAVVAWAV